MQVLSKKTNTTVIGGYGSPATQSQSESEAVNSGNGHNSSTAQSEHERLVSTIKMFFGFL